MQPRIALIHATPVAVEPINAAFRRLWPEASVTNLLEDSLAPDLAREGRITSWMTERFITLARYVRSCGADGIMFTCSAFGTAIEAARAAVDIPVLKPNEAMLDEAVRTGGRIGIIATFEPSIPSFITELADLAREKAVKLQTSTKAIPEALAALHDGRTEEHDRLIAGAAAEMADCDVLLLSQFSMASAAAVIPNIPGRLVLSSPASAVGRLKQLLS